MLTTNGRIKAPRFPVPTSSCPVPAEKSTVLTTSGRIKAPRLPVPTASHPVVTPSSPVAVAEHSVPPIVSVPRQKQILLRPSERKRNIVSRPIIVHQQTLIRCNLQERVDRLRAQEQLRRDRKRAHHREYMRTYTQELNRKRQRTELIAACDSTPRAIAKAVSVKIHLQSLSPMKGLQDVCQKPVSSEIGCFTVSIHCDALTKCYS